MSEHRGGFGDLGGDAAGALIDRSFRERIVAVGVVPPGIDDEEVERSLDELEQLVDTAGADVVDRVVQRRSAPEPATYIGKGKVAELRDLCEDLDVDTVVFDDELTPAQQVNLEKLLGRSAIDRTAVILDIFAQNAGPVRPVPLPVAPPAGQGPHHVPAGRRDRCPPRAGRDPVRDRSSPHPAAGPQPGSRAATGRQAP